MLKVLIPAGVHCCRVYCQGHARLLLAQQSAELAASRMLLVEAALEGAQGQWTAAEVGRQALLKALAARQQQASRHAAERLKAQVRRRAGPRAPLSACMFAAGQSLSEARAR